MSPDVIGLIFLVLFASTVTAVLMLMAEIARDTPQGGHVAVAPVPEYAGRHRRG